MPTETADFTSGEIAKVATELAAPPSATPPVAELPAKTDPTPAAAIVQPVTPEPKTPAPIPFEDHDRVVKGFHRQLDSFAWAKDLKPSEVRDAIDLASKYRQEHADREKTTATNALTADLQTEDGTRMFSEGRTLAAIEHAVNQAVAAVREELGGRLTPFESAHAEQERINGHVSAIVEARNWKGFDDHLDLINAEVKSARADGNTQPSDQLLRDVYIRVVVPKLSDVSAERMADEKKKWLEDLNKTTADTSTEVNPRRTPASSRKKDSEMSISELFADETAKRKAS